MQQSDICSQTGMAEYDAFKKINAAISAATDQVCTLKPEISLLIELYDAEKEGRILSASSVGLISGIPQTTTIRYLRVLQERGWIARSRHERDQRISLIRITPSLVLAFDKVFGRV